MSLSDIISLMALGVAIATGLANYLYTKKTFEASTYPLLKAWLVEKKRETRYPPPHGKNYVKPTSQLA